ncbi:hypothetical protein ACFSS8_03935 [Paracoccus kondratievae]
MRSFILAMVGVMGVTTAGAAQERPGKEERLWTCDTSIAGEKTEINYVRDAEFHENVGRLEKNFSGWGRITCPGYVTLREILRRNEMGDDGSYCLLWDKENDTYIGAQKGPRKGNALCRKTLCERVNSARQATFRNANALAVAGYDAVTQRPGATILPRPRGRWSARLRRRARRPRGLPHPRLRSARLSLERPPPVGPCGIVPRNRGTQPGPDKGKGRPGAAFRYLSGSRSQDLARLRST